MRKSFKLTEKQHALVVQFEREITPFANELIYGLMDQGVELPWAMSAFTHAILDIAAGTACRTRRDVLGGKPDLEKWRVVTQLAFERAVKRTAPETPAEPAQPQPRSGETERP